MHWFRELTSALENDCGRAIRAKLERTRESLTLSSGRSTTAKSSLPAREGLLHNGNRGGRL